MGAAVMGCITRPAASPSPRCKKLQHAFTAETQHAGAVTRQQGPPSGRVANQGLLGLSQALAALEQRAGMAPSCCPARVLAEPAKAMQDSAAHGFPSKCTAGHTPRLCGGACRRTQKKPTTHHHQPSQRHM
jgi:hypothetical protein